MLVNNKRKSQEKKLVRDNRSYIEKSSNAHNLNDYYVIIMIITCSESPNIA